MIAGELRRFLRDHSPVRVSRSMRDTAYKVLQVKEKLCAEGRMLFLSLWPPQAARLDNATLHRRCHEMGAAIDNAK